MSRFGELLREYRHNSRDPRNENRPLTLHRFVDELYVVSGDQIIYSHGALQKWEKGENQPKAEDRDLLVALIMVLKKFKGISTLDEANRLLAAGKYQELQPDEVSLIDEDWSNKQTIEPNQIHEMPFANPWLVFLSSIGYLTRELKSPPYRPSDQNLSLWSPERILILAIWFGAALLVWQLSLPLLYWPLQEPLKTVIFYLLSTIIIPTLIALVVWLDQRRFWPELQKSGGPGFLWTLVGALIGFHASYLLLFAAFLVLNAFDLPNLAEFSYLLQFLMALLVVFCTVLGARQVPIEIIQTSEELLFNRRDTILLITLALLGPIVGVVFYYTHSLLLDQPLTGALIVLAVITALSGFTVWQKRRTGTSAISAFAWAILIGLFWILYVLATRGLYQAALVTFTVAAVVIVLWFWESQRV